MKRVLLRRTPFRRRLNVSDEERAIRQAWLRFQPRCEISGEGVPPCFGERHVHEPWPRARLGPTDDPRNFVTACDHHNTWLSQTVGGLVWGKEHGMLFSTNEGRRWLEAGGRFPGLTREQAIALVMEASK